MKTKAIFQKCDGPTDQQTDRPTDRPTDIAASRVAFTRLKIVSALSVCCLTSKATDSKLVAAEVKEFLILYNETIMFSVATIVQYSGAALSLSIVHNYGKEKKRTLCFASFCLTMDLNLRKSIIVL